MKLVESFLTKNPCYTQGKKIKPKGLMLHSVGCPQPSAKVFVNNWNRSTYDRACVHAFIDANDGIIHQTLPWDHRGWHAGQGKNGSANDTHIGVEMCEPAQIKYTSGAKFTVADVNYNAAYSAVKRTYDSAVELFAMLCKKYDLNPLTDIVSHKEGAAKGIASNHGDPEHLWSGLAMKYTMNGFRKDVKAMMEKSQNGSGTCDCGCECCGKKEEEKPTSPVESSFKVKIDVTNLNIRTGPSTDYPTIGKYIEKGIYTITETSPGKGSVKGWGRLKSGQGWVALDFVKVLS